jgi:hypothetical protein
MAEMLKSFSRPGIMGLLFALAVVVMLTIPAEALAASSPGTTINQDLPSNLGIKIANIGWYHIIGEEVGSSPAIGDNSTIYEGSWYRQIYAIDPGNALQWSYASGNWFWYFPTIASDGAIDAGLDNAKLDAFSSMNATITIVSPKGGESYTVGKWQAITWKCAVDLGYYVKIELLKGGTFYQTITARTPISSGGNGTFVWIIPSAQTTGDNYRVKVTSTSNSTCTGTSENDFSITGPPISVISPSGGEGWSTGSQYAITWSYTGYPGPYVKIDLLKKGIYHCTIIPETSIGSSGNGFYWWTIPYYEMLGDNYQIRVTSTSDASYIATSENNFVITDVPSED